MGANPKAERYVELYLEILTIRSQSDDATEILQRFHELSIEEVIGIATVSIGFQVGIISALALEEGDTLPEAIATVAGLVWAHYYAATAEE